MEKSPEAFRTISEVADELDVPQHVLRFWETRFSQIKPMKRGGGRRYYRPNDVDLLKGIRRLLYGQGYTIRGVQRILREAGVSHVVGIGRGEVAADAIETKAPAPLKPVPVKTPAPPAPARGQIRKEASSETKPEAKAEVHEEKGLSRQYISELKLVLTELAAARRLLEPKNR